MRFIAHDPEYNAFMLTLNRECADALVETSRALRLQAVDLVAESRRLRLGCRQRSQLSACGAWLLISGRQR